MFTNILQFLNESFNKNNPIIIQVDYPNEMIPFLGDLKKWGYHYDEDTLSEENLNEDLMYPMMIIFSSPNLSDEFLIFSLDPYDGVTEEDLSIYNSYKSVNDFYDDPIALDYIKNREKRLKPNYSPRKIDRILEKFINKYKYNIIVVQVNSESDSIKIQELCFQHDITWSADIKKIKHTEYKYLYIWLNDGQIAYHDTYLTDNIDNLNQDPRLYTINDYSFIKSIIEFGEIRPTYNPRKIDRMIEKLNEGIDFISSNIKLLNYNNRPQFNIGEVVKLKSNILQIQKDELKKINIDIDKQNIEWINKNMNKELTINEIAYHNESGVWLAFVTNGYMGKYIVVKGLLKTNIPSYEPRKIIKESLNNKVLYAFDLDDTLVYSKRFEEHIKPLILKEEFLTPEIILNNKINDIGINIKDLKYEDGRVYFNDPDQLVNIIGNASWTRKGNRVYITQPDAYFLTKESMPVGVYNNILNIYNKSENKAIITSRKERLRKQTTSALNNLGVQLPNCGLFMYPSDSLVFQSKWKAIKLEELYNDGFTEIHYFDDNIKVLKRIKSYLKKDNINITLYKVNENNYRKI